MAIARDLGLNASDEVHRAEVTDPQVIARVTMQLEHQPSMATGAKCAMAPLLVGAGT